MIKKIKEIKENEKIQKFKELWHNKKTHDIMVLAIWFIFIFIVILFARNMTKPSSYQPEKENIFNLSDITSYEFTYKTNDKELIGQNYNNALLIYKDNKRYYYKDNLYLIDDAIKPIPNYDLDILKINLKMINNLITNINPTEENNTKQFIVPLDKFLNLYEIDTDIDLTKATLYNIPITIYYKTDQITKITLDLSNYYLFKTNTTSPYQLTIHLYNINNVANFTKTYDKLLEVNK